MFFYCGGFIALGGAGCVARGCAVVEAVEDVLYSLLARRAEEVPAALPSLMRCMAIYLDCLVFLGAQLAHLRPNSRLDRGTTPLLTLLC